MTNVCLHIVWHFAPTDVPQHAQTYAPAAFRVEYMVGSLRGPPLRNASSSFSPLRPKAAGG